MHSATRSLHRALLVVTALLVGGIPVADAARIRSVPPSTVWSRLLLVDSARLFPNGDPQNWADLDALKPQPDLTSFTGRVVQRGVRFPQILQEDAVVSAVALQTEPPAVEESGLQPSVIRDAPIINQKEENKGIFQTSNTAISALQKLFNINVISILQNCGDSCTLSADSSPFSSITGSPQNITGSSSNNLSLPTFPDLW